MGGFDAARAVTGTMYSPRSGGGPVALAAGEPPGLVPGGRGIGMVPVAAETGGRQTK
jgi:hypothetical protein